MGNANSGSSGTGIENTSNRDILMELFKSTNGEKWINNENWGSEAPLNKWYGVKCSPEDKVIGLDLYGNNLQGRNLCFLNFKYI